MDFLEPGIWIVTALVTPFSAAAVLLVTERLFPRQGNGCELGRLASMSSIASALVAAVLISTQGKAVVEQVENSLVYADRLAIVWMIFNGIVFCFSLRSIKGQSEYGQTSSSGRMPVAFWLVTLGLIQTFVIVNDVRLQWGLALVAPWSLLLVRSQSKTASSDDEIRAIVTFSAATLFWMLAIFGGYLTTGSLQQDGLLTLLQKAMQVPGAAALLLSASMSLMVAVVLYCGFFPFTFLLDQSSEDDQVCPSYRELSLLVGGFVFFRWLPLLTTFPESLTILIGLAALTAILLAASALFLKRGKRLSRLLGVLVAFCLIGISIDQHLTSQMVILFSGSLVLFHSLERQRDQAISTRQVYLAVGALLLLLCGAFGLEPVYRRLLQPGEAMGIQLPPVMLPLMVLALGIFVYGFLKSLDERHESDANLPSDKQILSTFGLLALLQFGPWFLAGGSVDFRIPFIVFSVIVIAGLVYRRLRLETFVEMKELSTLVELCRHDYHTETIFRHGLLAPLRLFAFMTNIFDVYLWRVFLLGTPPLIGNEANATTEELQQSETSTGRTVALILCLLVLLVAVYFTSESL